MNYGLYLAASGLLTNSYRQDVYANNLANVNTVGFKPDLAAVQARPSESVEDQLASDVSRKLLDQLGGGVKAAPQRISFALGPMQATGNPLDAYIENPNGFFAVEAADDDGRPATRYTRDGRFQVSPDGRLVTPAGNPVLSDGGKPIDIPEGVADLSLGADGAVLADGEVVAHVSVNEVRDLDALEKAGGNLFALKRDTDVRPVERAVLRPGNLEGSGADPVTTLMQMIAATKAATGSASMIRYHDTMMDRAVNTLGRVA